VFIAYVTSDWKAPDVTAYSPATEKINVLATFIILNEQFEIMLNWFGNFPT
jgi:hypothetical protein